MRIKIKVPKGANNLINILISKGYDAHLVGGCVRDSILNKKPHDWDICTSATPDKMREIFRNFKIVDIGSKYGTLSIYSADNFYECTTYRKEENYADGRHPNKITFSNLNSDLSRRDFTINAIAYNPYSTFIDPYNGISDIKNKIIKSVGNPDRRFKEDGLRILRAIRFQSQLGFSIEEATKDSMNKLFPIVYNNISQERKRDELCKILTGKYVEKALIENKEIIGLLIPEFYYCLNNFNQKDKEHQFFLYEHIVKTVAECPQNNLILRLAALLHDISKPKSYVTLDGLTYFYPSNNKRSMQMAYQILSRLRFDNKTINQVCELIFHHNTIKMDAFHIKSLLNTIGKEQTERFLLFEKANYKAKAKKPNKKKIKEINDMQKVLKKIIRKKECYCLDMLNISGKDIIGLGYQEGKIIGKTLQYLLTMVMAGTVKNKKEDLILAAKEYLHYDIFTR